MIMIKGQHVRCFMRSAMILEGFIEDWTDAQVILKSLDGQSLMIVHRPTEDIMLTKLVLKEPEEAPEKEIPKRPSDTKDDIRAKLQEVMNPTGEADLDKMNVDQLRQLVQEQDRQLITQKKREHFGVPGGAKRTVQYSSPYMPGKLPRRK